MRSTTRRHLSLVFVAIVMLCAALLSPVGARGGDVLVASDPAPGEILGLSPSAIVLTFADPPMAASATVRLVDQRGAEVAGLSPVANPDGALVVTLPGPLADGTYSVLWSAAGISDYVPFTIGPVATIRAASIPDEYGQELAPWWVAAARWLGLVGAGLLAAWWPVWTWIVAPRGLPRTTRRAMTHANLRLGPSLAAAAAVGTLAEPVARWAAGGRSAGLAAFLLDSAPGERMALRLVLIVAIASATFLLPWTAPRRSRARSGVAITLSVALAAVVARDGHGGDTGSAAVQAVATLHLAAAWLWVGAVGVGIALLAIAARWLPADARRATAISLGRRTLAAAVALWALLVISGLVLGLPLAGGAGMLADSDYGRALLAKSLAGLALLALALGRLLRRSVARPVVELALLGLLLATSAWLSVAPAGRDALADRQAVVVATLTGDATATLALSPGGPGPNHIAVTIADVPAPADARLEVRLIGPIAGMGPRELRMVRGDGATFEAHGSDIAAAGEWRIEATYTTPGQAPLALAGTLIVPATSPTPPALADPLRLAWGAWAGLALLVIGTVVLAALVATPGARREQSAIVAGAYVVGLVLLLQARLPADPGAAMVALDPALVAAGNPIYAAQCASCHGASGMGNGALAEALPYPPADFTSPAHQGHSAAALATWVRAGIVDRGMPAFAGTLSEAEIAAVVAYVQWLGGAGAAARDVPAPTDCTVEPRDVGTLIAMAQDVAPSLANEPAAIDWPQGAAVTGVAPLAVQAVAREFVACTNAGDYGRLLALQTTASLLPRFAALDVAGRQAALDLAAAPAPLAPEAWTAIVRLDEPRRLEDGRLALRVVTLDPANHPHETDVVLIFTEEAGRWAIDEVRLPRDPLALPTATTVPTTWPIVLADGGIVAEVSRGAETADGVGIAVRVRDAAGAPVRDAVIVVRVTPRGPGAPTEATLVAADPGLYAGRAVLPPGDWDLEIEIANAGVTTLLTTTVRP